MWVMITGIYLKLELIPYEVKELDKKNTFFYGKFYVQGEIILNILHLEL